MSSLRERVAWDGTSAVLRSDGRDVADVVRAIEAGDAAGLEPRDGLAALAALALGPEDAPGPPLVQQAPPRPALRAALSEPALAALLPAAVRPARLALAAGLLQVHDFWDPSHQAAQEADDLGERDHSAWWHGIGHRREPDFSNAAYWFRRVGRHRLFAPLGRRAAAEIPGAEGVVRGGSWDPMVFLDLCRVARPGTEAEALARRLQRLEMAVLLDATAQAALG